MKNFIEVQKPDGSIEYVASNFEELAAAGETAALNNPKIELTDAQIQESLVLQKIHEMQKYLADTDWYASRKAETGKEIPDDVVLMRQQARDYISANK